jgi:hypothetical protein
MTTISRRTADAVTAQLRSKPDLNVTELSVRTNIARPTIYKALEVLGAIRDDTYYPPTYRLPEPAQV